VTLVTWRTLARCLRVAAAVATAASLIRLVGGTATDRDPEYIAAIVIMALCLLADLGRRAAERRELDRAAEPHD
jgi:hypothetical protein